MSADLFGWDQPMKPKGKLRDCARGNAAPRGSGPEGETCKTCVHSYHYEYAKRYWKCDDIRLKWAACARWEKKPEPETKTHTDHEIENTVPNHDLPDDQSCPPLRVDERAAPARVPAGRPLPVLAEGGREEDRQCKPDGSVRGLDARRGGAVRGQDAEEAVNRIDAAFQAFHEANHLVYTVLVEKARAWKGAGHSFGSLSLLFEQARHDPSLATASGDGFKLNNFRSRYARLIMELNYDLRGFFKLRPIQ